MKQGIDPNKLWDQERDKLKEQVIDFISKINFSHKIYHVTLRREYTVVN